MFSKRYYRERAEYMRRLAKEAETESLKKGCLKAAADYQQLADEMDQKSKDAVNDE